MLLNTGSFYTTFITSFTIIVSFLFQYYMTSEAENFSLNKTFLSDIA
jgi:hypothetical protein